MDPAARQDGQALEQDFFLPCDDPAAAIDRDAAVHPEEKVIRRELDIVADPRNRKTAVLAALQGNARAIIHLPLVEDDGARDCRVAH
jgi:hypothetical protein